MTNIQCWNVVFAVNSSKAPRYARCCAGGQQFAWVACRRRQRSSICSPVTLHVTCYMLHVTHMLMLTMYTTHVIALLTKSSVYQPSNNWWVWQLNGILCHHIRFFIILEPFTPMLYNLEHINNSYRMAFRRIIEVPSHLNTLYISPGRYWPYS